MYSGRPAYDKILGYIAKAKESGGEILIGGTGAIFIRSVSPPVRLTPFPGDDSRGYFVQPTVILTKDPQSVTMVEEIFGPVITVYLFDSRYRGSF